MKPLMHAAAGALGMSIIASFWISTLISELLLDHHSVLAVKQAIVYGLFLLIPCMAATGASGFLLSKNRKGALLDRKKKRMAIIAANGLLLMTPMAAFLYLRAQAGAFDGLFYAVQILELIVGAAQLVLMSLNFRDGRRLAGKG